MLAFAEGVEHSGEGAWVGVPGFEDDALSLEESPVGGVFHEEDAGDLVFEEAFGEAIDAGGGFVAAEDGENGVVATHGLWGFGGEFVDHEVDADFAECRGGAGGPGGLEGREPTGPDLAHGVRGHDMERRLRQGKRPSYPGMGPGSSTGHIDLFCELLQSVDVEIYLIALLELEGVEGVGLEFDDKLGGEEGRVLF